MPAQSILGGLATEVTAQAAVDALTGTLAVSATTLPLPSGASTEATLATVKTAVDAVTAKLVSAPATAAAQTTAQTSLGAIDTKLGGTLAVSAAALPLPTGAATETTLAALSTKTPTLVSGNTPVISQGQRRDVDSTPAAVGEYHPLYTNSVGRLKVSTMPADYAVVTGSITAIQATPNTPVANATVFIDVGRISNLTIYPSGTFAGYNVIFEASLDSTNGTDGLWWGIQAARTNSNIVETVTGVLAASPAYAWEMSVNAYSYVRVRATARTSGTQVWTLTPGAYATEPAPAIQTHAVTGSGTFTVAGTVTANDATPTTTRTVTAATTNTAFIKAAAGTVLNLSVFNSSGATIFVKLYNQTTAPVLATAIPTLIIPVTAGAMVTYQFGALGERYATGIAIAVTGAVANTDTTVVAAGINVNTTFI